MSDKQGGGGDENNTQNSNASSGAGSASSSFVVSLVAGSIAGFTVDVSLFPLDTLKTRLQSPHGFRAAGGFRGIYQGLASAAAGSMPGAALFFATYDTVKNWGHRNVFDEHDARAPLVHMTAASMGEVLACLVRVPTENVKQRMQVGRYATMSETIRGIATEPKGLVRGLYTGTFSTMIREVPFSFIQFPIYEQMKRVWARSQGRPGDQVRHWWQAALCGSAAGAFAGAVTTPLDVVKTRLMLGADAQGVPYTSVADTMRRVYAEGGVAKLFSGIGPRTMWISIGGFLFLGGYEASKRVLTDYAM